MGFNQITPRQEIIFEKLKKNGVFHAIGRCDKNSAQSLVRKGKAILLRKDADDWVFGISRAAELEMEEYEEELESIRKNRKSLSLGVVPDAEREGIKRPPAEYSNLSCEQLIDHILKTY